MSKILKGLICFSVIMATAWAGSIMADAEEQKTPVIPRPILELKKHGTVEVKRGKDGKVESMRLIVTSYQITLDEGSKPLEDMDGQKVKALGTYKKIDDEGWFTVSKVEPLTVEAEAEAKEEPAKEKAAEKKIEKETKEPEKPAPEPAPEKPAEKPAPAK